MTPDRRLALAGAAALGAGCALALVLLDHARPAVAGEPLALRLARAWSDHPVRSALAVALARLALRGAWVELRAGSARWIRPRGGVDAGERREGDPNAGREPFPW